jgi:hypothetical protein
VQPSLQGQSPSRKDAAWVCKGKSQAMTVQLGSARAKPQPKMAQPKFVRAKPKPQGCSLSIQLKSKNKNSK